MNDPGVDGPINEVAHNEQLEIREEENFLDPRHVSSFDRTKTSINSNSM